MHPLGRQMQHLLQPRGPAEGRRRQDILTHEPAQLLLAACATSAACLDLGTGGALLAGAVFRWLRAWRLLMLQGAGHGAAAGPSDRQPPLSAPASSQETGRTALTIHQHLTADLLCTLTAGAGICLPEFDIKM